MSALHEVKKSSDDVTLLLLPARGSLGCTIASRGLARRTCPLRRGARGRAVREGAVWAVLAWMPACRVPFKNAPGGVRLTGIPPLPQRITQSATPNDVLNAVMQSMQRGEQPQVPALPLPPPKANDHI